MCGNPISPSFYSILLGLGWQIWMESNLFKYNRWQRRMCTLLVQLYSDVASVNSFMCPTKLLIIAILKCLSFSKISEVLCSLFSVFILFLILAKNGRKCCLPCYIWHCDVMYNRSISLLPPIVLDHLFGIYIVKGWYPWYIL